MADKAKRKPGVVVRWREKRRWRRERRSRGIDQRLDDARERDRAAAERHTAVGGIDIGGGGF